MENSPTPVQLSGIDTVAVPGYSTEDVLVGSHGQVFTGLEDGRIIAITADGTVREIANTNGRPLGLEFLGSDCLLVCDAITGLLSVDIASGEIDILVDEVDGQPLKFCNNAAVTLDGTIYFTSSSRRHGIETPDRDVIEYVPTGRLIERKPDGRIKVVLDELYFANGVALSVDETSVFVAETAQAMINRVNITDANFGERADFAANLPGLPDNLSRGTDGLIWAGLVADNDAVVAAVRAVPYWVRWIVARLPELLKPKPQKTISVIAFDEAGKCRHYFQGEHTEFYMATGVREHNGTVWLGSLMSHCVARFSLKDQPKSTE